MNLLKTKFYPVDLDRKIIYIDPMKRERDVAHTYGRGEKPCIGLTGARLMEKKGYLSYKRLPTMFKRDLLVEWKEEEIRSKYLWQGAARIIHDIIRDNSPAVALQLLKKQLKDCGSMGISAYYGRAVDQIKELISQEAQAA